MNPNAACLLQVVAPLKSFEGKETRYVRDSTGSVAMNCYSKYRCPCRFPKNGLQDPLHAFESVLWKKIELLDSKKYLTIMIATVNQEQA